MRILILTETLNENCGAGCYSWNVVASLQKISCGAIGWRLASSVNIFGEGVDKAKESLFF